MKLLKWLLITFGLVISFFVVAAILLPVDSLEVEENVIQHFELLDETVTDVPLKTELDRVYIFTDSFTNEEARIILESEYEANKDRKGFKHNETPTHHFYRIYPSETDVNNNNWIARLEKTNKSETVSIYFNESINLGQNTDEVKYGLTTEDRKEIFKQIIKIERANSSNAFKIEESNKELAKTNGLTLEELNEIGVEGIMSDWSMQNYD